MMAQNTSKDNEIESFVHKSLKDFHLHVEPPSSEDYFDFLCKRGAIYEMALARARPLNDTRSEAEREEDVKKIEDLLVWNMVHADFQKYRQGQPACGRIECWAASQKFVNIVVALIRPRGADDPKSVNEGPQPTPISKGLLALAIAAEKNDFKMVEALKHIAVADKSIKSSEPDLFSPDTKKLNRFYSKCDTPVYELYPIHDVWLCPIEAAARLGRFEMVRKLIELREEKMEAKMEALRKETMTKVFGVAEMEDGQEKERFEAMMEKILGATMRYEKLKYRRAFDWAVKMGHCQVVLHLIDSNYVVLNEASMVRGLLDKADEKAHGVNQTPLALTALSANFGTVKCLCEHERGLRTDAKPERGKSALQIAFEELRYRPRANHPLNPKPTYLIWKYIMERDDSRTEWNRLTEERKVHVDAVNAILVGTALIATATFAGWLSPPLGYSSPPGTDGPFASVEGHPILESFWVFNSLSFFFSIATFMVGANVAFPPPEDIYIGYVVQSLRWKLRLAYYLVSAAVFFVIGAFASAGFAVLPSIPKYTVNMALTVGIGVTVVAVVVFTTSFGHMFSKSRSQQLKHKMKKFRGSQQFKHKMEFSDDSGSSDGDSARSAAVVA